MGSDKSPESELRGIKEFLSGFHNQRSMNLILIGQSTEIAKHDRILRGYPGISMVEASDVVSMSDEPSAVLKSRPHSSMVLGLRMVKEGAADVFISAGNTGAIMAVATMVLGRIPNVSRPAIGTFLPTNNGVPTFLTDVGANAGSKAKYLFDFAVMGSQYYRLIRGVDHPSVGLLNVGEEPGKGTDVTRETYEMLAGSKMNFIGNVEGGDILSGNVNVVVCDGFEGNIILKFAESIMGLLKSKIRFYASESLKNKLLSLLASGALRGSLRDMDYQQYGGVPLLGVNGVVIIGHGKSSPTAISNMIKRAVEAWEKDINGAIASALADAISINGKGNS